MMRKICSPWPEVPTCCAATTADTQESGHSTQKTPRWGLGNQRTFHFNYRAPHRRPDVLWTRYTGWLGCSRCLKNAGQLSTHCPSSSMKGSEVAKESFEKTAKSLIWLRTCEKVYQSGLPEDTEQTHKALYTLSLYTKRPFWRINNHSLPWTLFSKVLWPTMCKLAMLEHRVPTLWAIQ